MICHHHKISVIVKCVFVLVILFLPSKLFSQSGYPRPNVLLIMVDDMKWNTISIMDSTYPLQTPNIDRIGNEGANVKYYSTNSICVPGRTSLLTGKYGHRTGVMNNSSSVPNSQLTLPRILHDSGYYVALLGKWMVNLSNPNPLFDYWLWTPGASDYIDVTCKYGDSPYVATGHLTDMLTDSAVDLISRIDTPFFMMLDHNAPHAPWIGQPPFDGDFNSTPFDHPQNYERYTQNYPSYLYADSGKILHSDNQYLTCMRNYTELMKGVDSSTGLVLDALTARGILDNTMIIFTTDNGFMIGNHKIVDKYKPYEDCIKMPLLIRYPQWFAPGTLVNSDFALNIDLAPTIFDVAGIPSLPAYTFDGVSVRDFYLGNAERNKFLYEQAPPDSANPVLRSFRDEQFQYTRYYCLDTTEELFDMQNDPNQLLNLVVQPAFQNILYQYRIKLDSTMLAMDDTTSLPLFPCYLKSDSITFFTDTINATICNNDSYNFNGTDYSVSGIYTDTFTVTLGFDSLAVLNLDVLPVSNTNIVASVCAGEHYTIGATNFSVSGSYMVVLGAANGCDSAVHLQLTVMPPSLSYYSTTICFGDTYNFNGTILSSSGNYNTVYQNISGCDSTVQLQLTVLPLNSYSITATICNGDTYNFNGNVLSSSGIYSATLTAANGCDSIVSLNLTELAVISTQLNVTMCAGQSYLFNGNTLTASGNYTAVFNSSFGCDSTVNLNLTFSAQLSTNISQTICFGETYNFNGNILTASGNYNAILVSSGGCDSTIHLALTVLPLSSGTASATMCFGNTYNFNGTILNSSGTYTSVFQNVFGCDSTVQLQLTELPQNYHSQSVTICNGESYSFNGNTLTSSGNYSATYLAANGCDSIIALSLTVLPAISSNLNVSICSGWTYTFDGNALTTSGNYSAVFISVLGCDSTVNLALTFANQLNTNVNASICNGSVYNFNGTQLTVAGNYIDTLIAAGGCDSVIALNLVVNYPSVISTSATICNGSQFDFNGSILTSSGIYSDTLQTIFGCDSVIHLTLSVVIGDTGNINAEICNSDSYNFFGTQLSSTGNYFHSIPTGGSCDSVVHLSLNVLPPISYSYNDTICNGETYDFNGNILTQDGNYTSIIPSANLCDSTIHMQLEVIQLSAFIQQSGDTLTTSGNGLIQWMNCNTDTLIPGATNPLFIPQQTGNFAAIITNGDCTDTTQCRHVTVTGITSIEDDENYFSIYPNPAMENVTIHLSDPCVNCLLEITNPLGQLLISVPLNHNSETINLSNLSAGLFFVKLHSPDRRVMRKFVKQ